METPLKKIRKQKGLTQLMIAQQVKVSIRHYQSYEAGKHIPNAYTAQLIAKALNTTVEKIFPLPQENDSTKRNTTQE